MDAEEKQAVIEWGRSIMAEDWGPSRDSGVTYPVSSFRDTLSKYLPMAFIDDLISREVGWDALTEAELGIFMQAGASKFLGVTP